MFGGVVVRVSEWSRMGGGGEVVARWSALRIWLGVGREGDVGVDFDFREFLRSCPHRFADWLAEAAILKIPSPQPAKNLPFKSVPRSAYCTVGRTRADDAEPPETTDKEGAVRTRSHQTSAEGRPARATRDIPLFESTYHPAISPAIVYSTRGIPSSLNSSNCMYH